MYEIRLHAALGQGAAICGRILATAAFHEGKFSSSFTFDGFDTEDGTETVFCRIDDTAIRRFHRIGKPDCIAVLDEMMLKVPSTLDGLDTTGKAVVNSPKTRYELESGEKNIYTVDATEAASALKHPLPGVPMAGAIAKVTGIASLESLFRALDEITEKGCTESCKKSVEKAYNLVK